MSIIFTWTQRNKHNKYFPTSLSYIILNQLKGFWASLLVQWLKICLAIQETLVRSLVWEDATCLGATKPTCHNNGAGALEPGSRSYWAHGCSYWSPHIKTREAIMTKEATAKEKPLQQGAHAPQVESSSCSLQLEEKAHRAMKTQHSQK